MADPKINPEYRNPIELKTAFQGAKIYRLTNLTEQQKTVFGVQTGEHVFLMMNPSKPGIENAKAFVGKQPEIILLKPTDAEPVVKGITVFDPTIYEMNAKYIPLTYSGKVKPPNDNKKQPIDVFDSPIVFKAQSSTPTILSNQTGNKVLLKMGEGVAETNTNKAYQAIMGTPVILKTGAFYIENTPLETAGVGYGMVMGKKPFYNITFSVPPQTTMPENQSVKEDSKAISLKQLVIHTGKHEPWSIAHGGPVDDLLSAGYDISHKTKLLVSLYPEATLTAEHNGKPHLGLHGKDHTGNVKKITNLPGIMIREATKVLFAPLGKQDLANTLSITDFRTGPLSILNLTRPANTPKQFLATVNQSPILTNGLLGSVNSSAVVPATTASLESLITPPSLPDQKKENLVKPAELPLPKGGKEKPKEGENKVSTATVFPDFATLLAQGPSETATPDNTGHGLEGVMPKTGGKGSRTLDFG